MANCKNVRKHFESGDKGTGMTQTVSLLISILLGCPHKAGK
jgi:hypothetical protein